MHLKLLYSYVYHFCTCNYIHLASTLLGAHKCSCLISEACRSSTMQRNYSDVSQNLKLLFILKQNRKKLNLSNFSCRNCACWYQVGWMSLLHRMVGESENIMCAVGLQAETHLQSDQTGLSWQEVYNNLNRHSLQLCWKEEHFNMQNT